MNIVILLGCLLLAWCVWDASGARSRRRGALDALKDGYYGAFVVSASACWSNNCLALDISAKKVALVNVQSYDHEETPKFRKMERVLICAFDEIDLVRGPEVGHGPFTFIFVHASEKGRRFGSVAVYLDSRDAAPLLKLMKENGFAGGLVTSTAT